MEYKKEYSYDREKFASVLDYDKYSLKIKGKRVFIFSGEFHYWRIPDRERWREILMGYKIGGLNCLRIYFHWGYHSPDENVYIFSDNRDLEYLFKLCEELGLYVLAAPGPYICAETSAGAFPAWLLAKREVYIRHLKGTGNLKYDPKFAEYSRQWYSQFIPIMAKHEITNNPNGCVIGLQVENELLRKKIITLGLDQCIEDLSKDARSFGCTVPIFHNDPMPEGSWVGGVNAKAASVDLYGFDKYIIWCPGKYNKKDPPEWENGTFEKRVDNTEKEIRGFGGWAEQTPIFIPELQGGWYNQWSHDHGFDEIYDYYGDEYTKTLVESFIAQGTSMFSLYMYYGGTNWGTIGDPDVYTSYDYSACIREFGFFSNRLKKLRLTNLFVKSFEEELLLSEAVSKPDLTCNYKNFIARQRHHKSGINFYFFRNFGSYKNPTFEVTTTDGHRATGNLNYRASFIGVGNYKKNNFQLIISTLPWLLRCPYEDGELWVFQMNDGELLFEGTEITTYGDVYATSRGKVSRIKFKKAGTGKLTNDKGKSIFLLALTEKDALTLTAQPSEESWEIAWGAYGLGFSRDILNSEIFNSETIYYLGAGRPKGFTFTNDEILKSLRSQKFNSEIAIAKAPIQLTNWAKVPIRWDASEFNASWKPINIQKENDPLDHLFTSGHVVYKCIFIPKSPEVQLKLNIRNKAIIWLNGQCVGGHITYSLAPLSAGAKNGPDPSFKGTEKYSLGSFLQLDKENMLIILVDSLGQCRGPTVLNDFRNPRGILNAEFSGLIENTQWMIGGIDVRKLKDVYNTTGLFGEQIGLQNGEGKEWLPVDEPITIKPNDELIWYRAQFNWKKNTATKIPLRIHLEGKQSIQLFVNGRYIGRYWGNYGPQNDFYIMDGDVKDGKNDLVFAAYTWEEDKFKIDVLPYYIDEKSGNIDEKGIIFATKKIEINL